MVSVVGCVCVLLCVLGFAVSCSLLLGGRGSLYAVFCLLFGVFCVCVCGGCCGVLFVV